MTHSEPTDHDPAALLAWYVAMGVAEGHGSEAVDRFAVSAEAAQPVKMPMDAVASHEQKSDPRPDPKTAPRPVSAQRAPAGAFTDLLEKSKQTARVCSNLLELRQALANLEGCSLKRTAANTVFCDGVEEAPLMVISAAPGAQEDKTGLAFQGQEGALLDRMLAAIGYSRKTNAYLAHIVPWRPLGNRNPDPQSMQLCLPFMIRHIELARPKAIMMLGYSAVQGLTSSQEGIARIRGKWQLLPLNGLEIAAMPSYHPDYLLKHPRYKRESWQDLLALKAKLEPES